MSNIGQHGRELERILGAVVRFFPLAFGNPSFAADEHRSSTQPELSGAAMSPLKKNDVKNHLSTHDRNGKSLYRPSNEPDATGFSGEESVQADEGHTAEESPREDAALEHQAGLGPVLVASTSKRERA